MSRCRRRANPHLTSLRPPSARIKPRSDALLETHTLGSRLRSLVPHYRIGATCRTAPDADRPATQQPSALLVSYSHPSPVEALYPRSTRRRTGQVSYSAVLPLFLSGGNGPRFQFHTDFSLMSAAACCVLLFISFCLLNTTGRSVSNLPLPRGRYCPSATGKFYYRVSAVTSRWTQQLSFYLDFT